MDHVGCVVIVVQGKVVFEKVTYLTEDVSYQPILRHCSLSATLSLLIKECAKVVMTQDKTP